MTITLYKIKTCLFTIIIFCRFLINNLSSNTSDYAIELLDSIATLEEFNWVNLSKNPCYETVKLLRKHQDYINWHSLSENPKIFEEIPNSRFVY